MIGGMGCAGDFFNHGQSTITSLACWTKSIRATTTSKNSRPSPPVQKEIPCGIQHPLRRQTPQHSSLSKRTPHRQTKTQRLPTPYRTPPHISGDPPRFKLAENCLSERHSGKATFPRTCLWSARCTPPRTRRRRRPPSGKLGFPALNLVEA